MIFSIRKLPPLRAVMSVMWLEEKKRSSKDFLKYVHAVATSLGIVIQKSRVVAQGKVDPLEQGWANFLVTRPH